MSVRSVSPLTLAVALLLGALGSGAAQESFQVPKNASGPAPCVRVEAAPGQWFTVPALGPLPLTFDTAFPVVKGSCDHRQMFNFTVGLFGCDSVPAAPPPAVSPESLSGGFGPYCAPMLPRLVVPADQPAQFVYGLTRTQLIAADDVPVPSEVHGACPPDGYRGLPKGPSRLQMSRVTTGGIGSYCAPALPKLAAPQLVVTGPGCIQLIATDDVLMVQSPAPTAKAVPNALRGTWYRELPGTVIVMTFGRDELKLCMTKCADGLLAATFTFTVTAHYAVSPDGLVYGTITGGDVNLKTDPKADAFEDEVANLAATMQTYVDAPFSFRTKMTSAGLMVSGLKCGDPLRHSDADLFGGMFKCAKDGKAPAPVAVKTPAGPTVGAGIGCATVRPLLAPSGTAATPVPVQGPVERVGVDFNIVVPGMGPLFVPGTVVSPPQAAPVPCPATPVRPAGCGVSADATKQLAQDAFGQLLQQGGVTRPAGEMTLPNGRYLEHPPQHFAPDPSFPLPRELACPESCDAVRRTTATVPATQTQLKSIGVGTWYRDVAGKQCVVKVTPEHLTLTVHDAQETDGKVSTASLVITADYHLARDGMTAVGLITSVDVNFEGDFPPEDSKPFFEMLGELQKVLEDKPFALTFRSYGDALVIGNVRMPTVSDRMEVQPAGYMAGRYKAAGDKIPTPKPVKVPPGPRAQGGYGPPPIDVPTRAPRLILPPGSAYPESGPSLPPPLPSSSNGDLLPPQQVPQAPRIVPSGGSDSWVAPMTEPTKPVLQMPQPVPPGEVQPVAQLKAPTTSRAR